MGDLTSPSLYAILNTYQTEHHMEMTTVDREYVAELTEMIEDVVQYAANDLAKQHSQLVSGETIWKIVSAYAETKEAEFASLVD